MPENAETLTTETQQPETGSEVLYTHVLKRGGQIKEYHTTEDKFGVVELLDFLGIECCTYTDSEMQGKTKLEFKSPAEYYSA